MSKKSHKSTVADRRARIAEMRKQQQAAERRRTVVVVGVSAVLAVGLLAAVAVPLWLKERNDPKNQPFSAFGVSASAAQCDPVVEDAANGSLDHVDGRVDYETVPPSSGPHRSSVALFERKFYTADDRPEMEMLVHNLEHGYTVVWYDSTITGEKLEALRTLSEKIGDDPQTGKFIVSAWDESYGKFPEGKHVAYSHWISADKAVRQLCADVSGEAIHAFMEKYPQTMAPEPYGG